MKRTLFLSLIALMFLPALTSAATKCTNAIWINPDDHTAAVSGVPVYIVKKGGTPICVISEGTGSAMIDMSLGGDGKDGTPVIVKKLAKGTKSGYRGYTYKCGREAVQSSSIGVCKTSNTLKAEAKAICKSSSKQLNKFTAVRDCIVTSGSSSSSASSTSSFSVNVSGPDSLRVRQQGKWTVKVEKSGNARLFYKVKWGDEDGNTSAATIKSSARTRNFFHRYSSAGTYTVKFWIWNDKVCDPAMDSAGYPLTSTGSCVTEVSKSVQVNPRGASGSIQVVSPNGGEILVGGTVFPIRWTSTGTIPNVYISRYNVGSNGEKYGGSDIATVANVGYYNWTVPNENNTLWKIVVGQATNEGSAGSDESNGAFTIISSTSTSNRPVVSLYVNGHLSTGYQSPQVNLAGTTTVTINWSATNASYCNTYGQSTIVLSDGTRWDNNNLPTSGTRTFSIIGQRDALGNPLAGASIGIQCWNNGNVSDSKGLIVTWAPPQAPPFWQDNPAHPASAASDSNTSTYYMACPKDTYPGGNPKYNYGYYIYDIGSIKPLTNIRFDFARSDQDAAIDYPASAPANYNIDISTDGQHWLSIRDVNSLTPASAIDVPTEQSARYIRLSYSKINDGTGWCFGLKEIRPTFAAVNSGGITVGATPSALALGSNYSINWTDATPERYYNVILRYRGDSGQNILKWSYDAGSTSTQNKSFNWTVGKRIDEFNRENTTNISPVRTGSNYFFTICRAYDTSAPCAYSYGSDAASTTRYFRIDTPTSDSHQASLSAKCNTQAGGVTCETNNAQHPIWHARYNDDVPGGYYMACPTGRYGSINDYSGRLQGADITKYNNGIVTADLGSVRDVKNINIVFKRGGDYPAAPPCKYKLQYSVDGQSWFTMAEQVSCGSNSNDSTQDINLNRTQTAGRYVRLDYTQVNDGTGWCVAIDKFDVTHASSNVSAARGANQLANVWSSLIAALKARR